MSRHHALPLHLTPGSKLREVYVAVRDHGGGLTLPEIADRAGYAGHQIAPLVWSLCQTRHLVDVGWKRSPEGWQDRVYATARMARHLTPRAPRKTVTGE